MPSLDHGSAPSRVRPANRQTVGPVVTLCLSVVPGATELVVVRGDAARGTVLDRVHTPGLGRAAHGSQLQQAVDTVLQTRKLAIVNGYRVHAVGVIGDGSDDVIAALEDAGLSDVTTLDPAVAREIFTQPDTADIADTVIGSAGTRARRRWMFTAAMVIASAALLFAMIDRWEASHRHFDPGEPAVAPRPNDTPPPTPPPSPVTVSSPPGSPAQSTPEPPTPTNMPTRQEPVQRPPVPQPPPSPPPVELPERAPEGNCLFLCGVTL